MRGVSLSSVVKRGLGAHYAPHSHRTRNTPVEPVKTHNVCARDFGNRRFYNKLPTSFDADREPLRIIHTGCVPAHLLKLVHLRLVQLGDNKLSGEDFDFPSRTCMLFSRSFSACSLELSHILNSNEYFMGAFTGAAPSAKELKDLRRALVSSGDKCKGMTQSGLECSDEEDIPAERSQVAGV